ncbi:MAG TPA: hypothetical protein ENN61_02160 [Bacteroidaceae bacterium]|mgnify:CR=1 FL=1|nr:hypothetical protein [Bacteroidaceae bacterium]
MDHKIKELTEKIRREGLEKANKEAEEIIEKARNEAGEIIHEAKKKADSIINTAKKQAEDISQRMTSEVRLSSQQAILNLKKEISELIQTSVLKEPLKQAFNDQKFVRTLLETLVKKWDPAKEEGGLQVFLPKDQLQETETYFRENLAGVLNKGLSLGEYRGTGKGFEIQPKEGHYKINITDEAFEIFLKEHFKPVTLDFLYGGKS